MSGSTGIANVDGSGSTLSVAQNLILGDDGGTGTLNVTNGGVANIAGNLSFGAQQNGQGTLSLATGGVADVTGDLTLGVATGSVGTVKLLGGTLRLHGGTIRKGFYGGELVTFTGGRLEGVGSVSLNTPFVQGGGTLAVGTSGGTTTINSGYTLSSGKLEVTLSSAAHPLSVKGVVDLQGANHQNDGVLTILLGSQPILGTTYVAISNEGTNKVVGTFVNGSSAKAAYNGLLYSFGINYAAGVDNNDVVVTAQSVDGPLGDYNRDGIVNDADYVTWRNSQNSQVLPYIGADGNGDGVVNDADFQVCARTSGDPLRVVPASSLLFLNRPASSSCCSCSADAWLACGGPSKKLRRFLAQGFS